MRRLFFILFLFIAFACCIPHGFAAGEEHFVIFQTTDIHGNIGKQLNPGAVQIASEIRRLRKDLGESTLWIDCGDLTQGVLSATFDRGASMVDALNAAGCDIFVPGNHEFDYGREILIRNLNAFRGTVLAANLKITGYDKFKPWTLMERGKFRIAVIGLIPPCLDQMTRVAAEFFDGITVTPAEDAIARCMPDIIKSKPDAIVLAIHLGEYTEPRYMKTDKPFLLSELASAFPQINLILSGHSHSTVPGKRLTPDTWLAQAPAQGKDAVRVDILMKQDEHKITSISSKLLGINASSPVDDDLQKIFAPIRKQEESFVSQKVAEIDFDLKTMRNSKTPCRLAEELCRAMCEATESDIAFSTTISGFTKPAGIISERDLFQLLPYCNQVVVRKLTAVQLRTILRELETAHSNSGTWMTWTGLTLPDGINGPLILSKTGKELANGELVSVAFVSHAASGGGGRYPELAKIVLAAPKIRSDLPDLRDVFRNYLKSHYPVK